MSKISMALIMFVAVVFMTLVHEAAHALTARAFKIPITEFGIGFGPKIAAKKIGNTTFSLNLLPFGGFCSFADPKEQPGIDKAVSDKFLYTVPSWQRALVLLAGPFSNIAMAIGCFAIAGISPLLGLQLMGEMGITFLQSIGELFNISTMTQGGMITASLQMADIVMSNTQIWKAFWVVAASINFLLGLTNLLPFPALDGFSAIWALAETVTKRKFSMKVEGKLKLLGTIAIYIMMFMCCIGDILHVGNFL